MCSSMVCGSEMKGPGTHFHFFSFVAGVDRNEAPQLVVALTPFNGNGVPVRALSLINWTSINEVICKAPTGQKVTVAEGGCVP